MPPAGHKRGVSRLVPQRLVPVLALALAACGGPLTITPTTLPPGAVGIPYHAALASTGDKPIAWHVESGALPDGVTLSSSTGDLDGTPTSPGTFDFTVKSTEDGTLHSNDGHASFEVVILPKLVVENAVPTAQAGQTYAHAVQVSGGVGPYTVAVRGLPAHFTFDATTNEIHGSPDLAGQYTIEIDVTDSGTPQQTAVSKPVLTIRPVKVSIEETALPDATHGTFYSETLHTVSGAGPFQWSIVDQVLPDGLSLDPSTGTISGTPSRLGTFSFTLQVADQGSPPDTATQNLSITVH